MKLAGGCFIALALCTHVNAINFWLAEKDGASSCFDGAHDCGTTYSVTVITGNGNTPGCKDGDNHAAAFPPPDVFQGLACGVKINFYKKDGNYFYYKDHGDGTVLGSCVSNSAKAASCPYFNYVEIVQGRYACTNYKQVVNGINPCQN